MTLHYIALNCITFMASIALLQLHYINCIASIVMHPLHPLHCIYCITSIIFFLLHCLHCIASISMHPLHSIHCIAFVLCIQCIAFVALYLLHCNVMQCNVLHYITIRKNIYFSVSSDVIFIADNIFCISLLYFSEHSICVSFFMFLFFVGAFSCESFASVFIVL